MRPLPCLVLIVTIMAFAGAIASGCGGSDPVAAGPGSPEPTAAYALPWPSVDGGCPTQPDANVTNFDLGSSEWACTQALCATELSQCAADCECNNEILTALACVRLDGGIDECFSAAFATVLKAAKWSGLFDCLSLGSAECLLTDGAVTAACTADSGDGGCAKTVL
jgi:hypothetical protein